MAVVLDAFDTLSLPTKDSLLFSFPISKKEKQTGIVFLVENASFLLGKFSHSQSA